MALRKAGIEILARELSPLGMALFLRQFESGYGDYTRERDALLSDMTMKDIEAALEEQWNSEKLFANWH